MHLSWKHLHKLKVQTESGDKVGHIIGVTVDTQTHQVLQYEVKGSLLSKALLISFDQVISMTSDLMVVSDALVYKDLPIEEATRLMEDAKMNQALAEELQIETK